MVPLYQSKPLQFEACQGLSWDGPGTMDPSLPDSQPLCPSHALSPVWEEWVLRKARGFQQRVLSNAPTLTQTCPTNACADPRVWQ